MVSSIEKGQSGRPEANLHEVGGPYEVLLLPLHDAGKVEDKELQTITVARWQVLDSLAHGSDSFFVVANLDGVQKLIVDLIRDQWGRESTEILLQKRGDSIDVEIWIRDIKVIASFEAFSDDLNLAVSSAFAIDAFHVHAYSIVSALS